MEFLRSAPIAASPDERVASLRRRAALLFGLALILLGIRDWILLAPALLTGETGLPLVALQNKLAGWLAQCVFLSRRTPYHLWAALAWEWAPMVAFGAGLWLWTGSASGEWPVLRGLRRLRPLPICVGLAGICAAISLFCFNGMPHVQDSVAQQFQARLFADGQPFGRLPRHPEFFLQEFLVQHRGRWFSQYPPGQAALLALGELAGAPWLVNPIAGALAGWLLYLAARRAYDRTTAGLALALYALSPFAWFMSGERMNHVGTLLWLSAALWAVAPALSIRRTPVAPYRWALAGLFLGLAISTRPLCGAAFALPLLVGALWPREEGFRVRGSGFSNPSARAHPSTRSAGTRHTPTHLATLALGAGLAAGITPLLWFNHATTGSALWFGYEIQWGSSGWGFGQSQWGPPHTLARGLGHLWINWDAAAKYLFEWPIPSLLPLAGLLVRARRPRLEWVLIGTLFSVSLAYVPYFFQDLCLGPRFLYAGLPALVLLSARGLRAAGLAWAARQRLKRRAGVHVLTQAAAICCAAGLLTNLPVLARWYSGDYWGNGPMLVDAAHEQGLEHAIVFIRDYNRARIVKLRLRGVSWRTAQGAVEKVSDRWIDEQIREVDGLKLPAPAAGAALERRLAGAMGDPDPPVRRRTPLWVDYRGRSSNFNEGMWANTHRLEEQDVIYALDLEERNELLLHDFPGRRAWIYDWDPSERRFGLRPLAEKALSVRR